MAWGTFLFVDMLHGKFVNMPDFLAQLISIFAIICDDIVF